MSPEKHIAHLAIGFLVLTYGCARKDPDLIAKEAFEQEIVSKSDIFKKRMAQATVLNPAPGANPIEITLSGEPRYDVTKTNSVVSPFVGSLFYEGNLHSSNSAGSNAKIKASYIYKDKHWVLDGVSVETDTTGSFMEIHPPSRPDWPECYFLDAPKTPN